MRDFVDYWIAVLKLTKAQAFALFYRFVRYSAEEYTERGWYNQGDDDV